MAADPPQPAAAKPAATQAPVTVNGDGGTTIVGEQESAMGLYLTPWKDEYATGMDQAPALFDAGATPIASRSLRRQTEYRDAVSSYRLSHFQQNP